MVTSKAVTAALCLTLALLGGQAKTPPNPTAEWQTRYDAFVGLMKKRNYDGVLKLMHRDYAEISNGVVVGKAQVRNQLPVRCDTFIKFKLKPQVTKAKPLGATVSVWIDANYKATRKESGKTVRYESRTKLLDTWVKAGAGYLLYRSNVVSSVLLRNGKVVKRPRKPQ